jgi:hypothetical protein
MAETVRHHPALTFRISWVRPWLLAVALMAAALLVIASLRAAAGESGAWVGCALVLAICSAAALVPIMIVVATHRWRVDADGIGGRDNWHVYRRVGWAEIASVSPRPIPGYRFVWVNSRSRRRAFWLPLFLTDMEGFRNAVARHAPPDNPLRLYLEGRLPEGGEAAETA